MPKNRFTADDLKKWGFVEQPDGSFKRKSDCAVGGRLAAGVNTKQKRALDKNAQTKSGRKARGKKSPFPINPKWRVTMTAHIPVFMDWDNLGTALKPIQDELADALGLDDGEGEIDWQHSQARTRGEPGVTVLIEPITTDKTRTRNV